MSGNVKCRAIKSAIRSLPIDATTDPQRVKDFIAGYMAGHAAHTRWANKVVGDYRNAVRRAQKLGGEQG